MIHQGEYGLYMDKIDKTAFSLRCLHDGGDEKQHWRLVTPQERIQAIETMRKILYGENATAARLQRVIEVAKFKKE